MTKANSVLVGETAELWRLAVSMPALPEPVRALCERSELARAASVLRRDSVQE